MKHHPMVVFFLVTVFVCTGGLVGMELGLTYGGTDWWGMFGFTVSMLICTVISYPIMIWLTSGPLELDWDKLPKVLPNMVRSKIFTREQAIRIYDAFFYSSSPEKRAADLQAFAPLPPKKRLKALEN